MELKNKLIKSLILTSLVLASVLLLMILLQPNNVVIDEEAKAGYSSIFGWLGLLLSLPLAWVLVKDHKPAETGKLALVFHYIGLYGTRFCVVAIMYLLFRISGYLVPDHIVNLSAFETYKQKVDLVEYRVSTGYDAIRKNRSWYSFLFVDEFLVIRYSDGRKMPLNVNNFFGSNKLEDSAIASRYESGGFSRFSYRPSNVIGINTSVYINGRRHALGHTIDSITLK